MTMPVKIFYKGEQLQEYDILTTDIADDESVEKVYEIFNDTVDHLENIGFGTDYPHTVEINPSTIKPQERGTITVKITGKEIWENRTKLPEQIIEGIAYTRVYRNRQQI